MAKRSSSSSVVHVGLTQFACVESPKDNLARQLRLIDAAAKSGAQIVCTQELFTSLYFCQGEDHRFFDYAEPIPGPSTKALQAAAIEMDDAKRRALLEESNRLFMADRPSLPLVSVSSAWAVVKDKVAMPKPRADEDTLAYDIRPAK